MTDKFDLFPLHNIDDPDTYYLDLSRIERVHTTPETTKAALTEYGLAANN